MRRRQLVRTAAPPILAFGLALLLTHPGDTRLGAVPRALPTGGATAATSGGDPTVPAVSFTDRVRLVDGRLRTAVLVGRGEPAGTAWLAGTDGCAVPARPGIAAWLDCAYAGQPTVTVVVTLSDGRRLTHTTAPTVG